MNKAEAVAKLVGSHTETNTGNQFSGHNAALAVVLGRDRAMVTRMIAAGWVPHKHNQVLMAWAVAKGLEDDMWALLEHTCPCCGHVKPQRYRHEIAE